MNSQLQLQTLLIDKMKKYNLVIIILVSLIMTYFFKEKINKTTEGLITLFAILSGVVLAIQSLTIPIYRMKEKSPNPVRALKFKKLLKIQVVQFFCLVLPIIIFAFTKSKILEGTMIEPIFEWSQSFTTMFALSISIFIIPIQNITLLNHSFDQ